MIAFTLAIAWALGAAIARSLDPQARGARLAALAFPLGIGACALALGALSALGVPWSRGSALTSAALLLVIAAAAATARMKRAGRSAPGLEPRPPRSALAWIGGALVAVLVAGHALFATLAPPGEWDFWAIWGLKGNAFHAAARIDWAWLERPANQFAHPDYPILLPLAYDFAAAIEGTWPERQLGLLFTAFAASILLVTASHLREATRASLVAAAGALALAGPVLALPVGLADLPLLVYGGIALLELRSAAIDGRRERFAIAAAALALAALTKNEGIALVVAAAAGLVAARQWRRLGAVAPAAVAAASWIAIRSAHGLSTDLFGGGALARLGSAIAAPAALLRALGETPPEYPLFWIAVALAVAAGGARRIARERLLLVAVAAQIAFFFGAYLVTPRDVAWHVATSWPRLLAQLVVPIAFVAILFAAEALTKAPAVETPDFRLLTPDS